MTYLITMWDSMFTGSESYMLSEGEFSVEDVAETALKEYVSLWGDEIGDKERLVQQGLVHFTTCHGCVDVKLAHELGVDIGEDRFEEYQVDNDYFPNGVAIDVRVLVLDQHQKLKELCVNSPIMKPEELLRGTSIDFKYKDFARELAKATMYHREK